MPKERWRRLAASAVLAAAATFVVAASATAATTYRVSGEQIVVDATTGQTVMRGSLIGDSRAGSARPRRRRVRALPEHGRV